MKGAISVLLLAVLQSTMTNAAVNPDTLNPGTFFPDLNKNLTKVVWVHAANSKKDLDDALKNPDVMMVEADVVLGTVVDNDKQKIPIMAHPPADKSDLSLQEFVKLVNEENKKGAKKGVKLDFKTIEAFTASKEIIKKDLNNGTYPVFINADILEGPVEGAKSNVTANSFLSGAKEFENVTLSLGWTTKVKDEKDVKLNGSYTADHVSKMISTVKNQKLDQPITFALRAKFAANSTVEQMKLLVNHTLPTRNSSLTIWSPEDEVDDVDAAKLSKLITDDAISVNNVYIDVPEKLMKKLDLNGASGLSVTMMTLLGSLFVNFFLTVMPRRG